MIKGTKITMQQPRLTGFTTDSRAYEFTANAAAQDITKPDFVELQQIRAKMEMADKSTVDMSADTGVYDMKTEMLTLNNNIHLVSSTGYEGRLSEAVVDMRKGNVVSEKPVWVKLLDGFLNAKRLEIVNNGEVIRFGGVTMTLQPGKEAAKVGRAMRRRVRLWAVAAALTASASAAAQGPHPTLSGPESRAAFRGRTRISRSRSTPRRWKSATRARLRPSPAMCRWCRVTPR